MLSGLQAGLSSSGIARSIPISPPASQQFSESYTDSSLPSVSPVGESALTRPVIGAPSPAAIRSEISRPTLAHTPSDTQETRQAPPQEPPPAPRRTPLRPPPSIAARVILEGANTVVFVLDLQTRKLLFSMPPQEGDAQKTYQTVRELTASSANSILV
ncbi:MAG: hypothetical protein AAF442_03995 [Pseudomonadota bacterium]